MAAEVAAAAGPPSSAGGSTAAATAAASPSVGLRRHPRRRGLTSPAYADGTGKPDPPMRLRKRREVEAGRHPPPSSSLDDPLPLMLPPPSTSSGHTQ